MINVHPSLLPAFPGIRSYRKAFEQGCHQTGVTIHLVESEVDGGPICAQESFSIKDCKTVEEVEEIGLEVEHRLFPQTIDWFLKNEFNLESRELNGKRRLCVFQN